MKCKHFFYDSGRKSTTKDRSFNFVMAETAAEDIFHGKPADGEKLYFHTKNVMYYIIHKFNFTSNTTLSFKLKGLKLRE